eukprot:TRINITY_DN3917_c0_g1_i1.p1 TRINITY_DN3917_c0_g1~~TRINITY_DN3917_c0_g1_i1.p1  ORF type:complete len:550 (+),score=71.18 TRINITY_DN3917_c0_g1_i1:95-1651(+)
MKVRQAPEKSVEEILSMHYKRPAHKSEPVQLAAQLCLFGLLNLYGNFPTPAGCAQNSCIENRNTKYIDPKKLYGRHIHFLFNETIISVEELDTVDSAVRITSRNWSGLYVWDFKPPPIQKTETSFISLKLELTESKGTAQTQSAPLSKSALNLKAYNRQKSSPPIWDELRGSGVNAVQELLHFLDETPDTLKKTERTKSCAKPITPHAVYSQDLYYFQQSIEKQHEMETAKPQSGSREPLPPILEIGATYGKYHHIRVLLSNLGLLSPGQNGLKLFEFSERFARALADLDNTPTRLTAKVGVVFVKQDQEEQLEILSNTKQDISQQYQDFLSGLGWLVDLATHRGYVGGLDRKGTHGKVAPYFCDANAELIYHELTGMPLKEGDSQQVQRKRHVGNDSVLIIWSENKKPYNVDTIVSQFNQIFLIIYPVPNAMYRISIVQKSKKIVTGPLQDGMIISSDCLSQLVRETVMNACISLKETSWVNPQHTRAKTIKDMSRYLSTESLDSNLAQLFTETISS